MELTLTWAQCELAAYAGMKRHLLALHDHRHDRYGFKQKDPWGEHIESAGAELAVSILTGLRWSAWERNPADVVADVGEDIQVRRRGEHGWNLIVHRQDDPLQCFVLVYGKIPHFTIAGWIEGVAAQDELFWGDPFRTGRPAFWIPEDYLNPAESLTERPRADVIRDLDRQIQQPDDDHADHDEADESWAGSPGWRHG
jgi:hypothetical protein